MNERDPFFTRRGMLLAGAALVLGACTSRTGGKPWEQRPGMVPGSGQWHTVKAGETLGSIAEATGAHAGDIVTANNLTSTRLVVGQRLWLPGVETGGLATAGARSTVRPATPQEQVQLGDGYRLLPRSAWTAEPLGPNRTPMGAVTRITIHHTVEEAQERHLSEVELLRRVDHYHRTGRRWACIGYHYIVGSDGTVYEGRPAKLQGAHVSSANENNLGISVMGDFSSQLPNPRQLAALKSFLGDQMRKYRIGKNRIYGHRDLGASECPGDAFYGWMRKQGYTKKPQAS